MQKGKDSEVNKQTRLRKEGRGRGCKCEDGHWCMLMLTGLQATIGHTTCNSKGGLYLGGHCGGGDGSSTVINK